MARRLLPSAGVAALVALAAADVFLVKLALDHVEPVETTRTVTAGGSPGAGGSSGVEPGPGSGSGSPSPGEAGMGEAPVPEGPLLLAQAADGTLVRATFGGCTDDSDPQVAVSLDGGVTFRVRPVATDLDAVLAAEANGARDLRIVGADADCTATAYAGGARAALWDAGPTAPYWHLVPPSGETVHSPTGIVETPCVPRVLSTVGAVRLLCEDGQVLGTADGGTTWATLGRLDAASAFAFDGPSRGYAIVDGEACSASVMVTTDGGASWLPTECIDGGVGRAIAARGEVVTALVDDAVWRSDDGGETWSEVG